MNNYLGFFLILGLLAVFGVISGSYQTLYFGLGLLLLLWLGLRDTSRKIGIKEDLSGNTGFAGTAFFIKLQLFNQSWFPVFWCTASRAFSEELGANFWQILALIRPYGYKAFQMEFYPERRGIYKVPDLHLSTGDPFGWKENNIKITSPAKIVVYPPLYSIVGLNLTRHLPWGQTVQLFGLHEDPSRLRGCRDYQPGDDLKKIHWPNLARTGALKVKEWETTLTAENGIFLNLAEADYPVGDWFWQSELGIDFAASLVHQLIGCKETLGLYCNGKLGASPQTAPEITFKFAPRSGHEQGKRLLTFLAGVALQERQPYSLLFNDAYRLKNGSCLLFITPLITTEMVKRAHGLKQAGYHPLFLWLYSMNVDLPLAGMERAKIPCYTVEKRRNIHAFLITRTK